MLNYLQMHEKVKFYRISDVAFSRKMFCLLWQPRNFETFGLSIAKFNRRDI